MMPFEAIREIMKDSRYDLVPLHKRPDFLQQCCNLLNSEWKRSKTARLRSLTMSCDKFPMYLLLLSKNTVLGLCKISLVHNTIDSVVIESFIIDHAHRYQGLGSMLLRAVEDYVHKRGIKNIFLMTKGQEDFYLKNEYIICEPIQELNGYSDFGSDTYSTTATNSKIETNETSVGPPPPPMPDFRKSSIQICLAIPERTFMKKILES
ncbi:PREDICTED: N-acetyltransferase 6 isoform X2 [Ceratosolen solmsi marchali]|uniref:N-acetyltransferase 6 isoform X2 n=1 Tax=Ceratosolen solmsi marchali TaxID=326594 RepID=A0AAJ6YTJ9_9HYME|nr:PREDICTED: N-acetyltransferase 6 isoform X2 [Ceratosolen solmsi marchali]